MTSLQITLKRFSKSRFFRDVATVMSGTTLAQIIGLLLMPVISRLYSPQNFGMFGSFLAIIGIFSTCVTLQYHQALMLPPSDEDSFSLVGAACLSTTALSVLFLILAFLVLAAAGDAFPNLNRAWVPFALGIAIFVSGLNQTFLGWSTRRKAFRYTAISQVSRSIGAFGSQLIGGLFGFGSVGLIGGNIFGDLASTILIWRSVLSRDLRAFCKSLSRSHVRRAATKYRDFPIFSMPQNVMNAISQGLPVLLLGHYFGASVAGYYAFGIRILQVPMNFILNSLQQVLFQRISETYNNGGNVLRLYKKTTLGLAAMALVPSILGFLYAPSLFSLIFGEKWRTAGEYASWLVLWLSIRFCNVPSDLLARVLRQQRNLLFFEILILASRISVIVIGGRALSALLTVKLFSIVGAFLNFSFILWVAILADRK